MYATPSDSSEITASLHMQIFPTWTPFPSTAPCDFTNKEICIYHDKIIINLLKFVPCLTTDNSKFYRRFWITEKNERKIRVSQGTRTVVTWSYFNECNYPGESVDYKRTEWSVGRTRLGGSFWPFLSDHRPAWSYRGPTISTMIYVIIISSLVRLPHPVIYVPRTCFTSVPFSSFYEQPGFPMTQRFDATTCRSNATMFMVSPWCVPIVFFFRVWLIILSLYRSRMQHITSVHSKNNWKCFISYFFFLICSKLNVFLKFSLKLPPRNYIKMLEYFWGTPRWSTVLRKMLRGGSRESHRVRG